MSEHRLVPVVPTMAMVRAFIVSSGAASDDELDDPGMSGQLKDAAARISNAYAAMLAAAPAPEQQVEQEPVGYRITDGEGGYEYRDNLPDVGSIAWSARYGRIWESLYAAPPAAPDVSGLERDAARYRWLREHLYVIDTYSSKGLTYEIGIDGAEVPDIGDPTEAIDAALSAHREQQGEKP